MGGNTSKEKERESTLEPNQTLKGRRHTFHNLQFRLEPELLEYLQAESIFSCKESELEDLGYFPCVDYPWCPKHVYYEGYFHGLATHDSISSMNPRYGQQMDKPAAPLRFRGYLLAFKAVNDIQDLIDRLPEGPGKEMVESDYLFADIACQIHFGEEISGEHKAWHIDGPNSLLHLATSIHGTRGLHLKHMVMDEESHEDGQNETEQKEVLWQTAGNVYLSSPFTFDHCVEYPYTKNYNRRICAIQARFLFPSVTDLFDSEWDKDAELDAIVGWMESNEFRLPTLPEVQEQVAKLEQDQ